MLGETPALHHFELCVSDETPMLTLLTERLGFSLWLKRTEQNVQQWALRSHDAIFIVTKRPQSILEPISGYPILFCCPSHSSHEDSVFNVALEVRDVQRITDTVESTGVRVLHEPRVLKDQHGSFKFSVVESACKNVIHTLIERSNYTGFIPGFASVQSPTDILGITPKSIKAPVKYFDHVTYVCDIGESVAMIEWYEKCFGMKRFLANRDETLEDGFVLGDPIGLRLKALQYWKCAETGVGPNQQGNDPSKLNIVIAEPIPGVEASHVKTFLRENGGPGVQHIGLYSDFILNSVDEMQERGVKFRMPPYTYYQDFGRDDEIANIGLSEGISSLQKLGVLLDFEPFVDENGKTVDNWLMQIFTHPVFRKDTFFLEVIQRDGAIGFGAGNITALAKSILRYNEEMKKS